MFNWLKENKNDIFKKELMTILLCIGLFDVGVVLFFYYILFFNVKTYGASSVSKEMLSGAIILIVIILFVKMREIFVMQMGVNKKDIYIQSNLNREVILKKKEMAVRKMDKVRNLYSERKMEELVKYVEDNLGYERKTIVEKCDSICLNAIISNYIYKSEETGVIFEVECLQVVNDLNTKCHLDSKILNTIFGNLLDNALEALLVSEIEDKKIKFHVKREGNELVYIVWNNGPKIKDVAKIFKSRYSTKGKGRGMGLVAVQRIIESCDAGFEVESVEDSTKFEIRFQIH